MKITNIWNHHLEKNTLVGRTKTHKKNLQAFTGTYPNFRVYSGIFNHTPARLADASQFY